MRAEEEGLPLNETTPRFCCCFFLFFGNPSFVMNSGFYIMSRVTSTISNLFL